VASCLKTWYASIVSSFFHSSSVFTSLVIGPISIFCAMKKLPDNTGKRYILTQGPAVEQGGRYHPARLTTAVPVPFRRGRLPALPRDRMPTRGLLLSVPQE